MTNLKLGKLPDRTPSKITITVSAELSQALNDYAVLYRQAYGESETVAELIPYMLHGFLEGDRAFAKARKEGVPAAGASEKPRRQSASTTDNA
ncbi:DUF2274 domain-containing protein [Mesorhizobium sp. ORS 3428]|uniref:DUF2274 domain-containing protein n=1 Tax=Mesorhizobium sp. ORS 3428 TaxID=540997 RepID=UPI0008DA598A|nr:DUF2274 domain-containing protein [Mesorhizobium sp. ORS 3428]OHV86658.1 transposase [Mesorhizobium sp. ORS 3428]